MRARRRVRVRAPARVNLIGEHTDYNGLPVLPIAIEQAVEVHARSRADVRVELTSDDPRFPPRRYRLAATIPAFTAGDWGNYHKAAAQALAAELARRQLPPLPGGRFEVTSNVPVAAGLSSSSALLVALGLAHLALADLELPRLELAELFAAAERYVGTLSGGMDQAATLLATAGHALRIDFFPLRVRAVPVPAEAVFVVAHSLERAEKSGGARGHYNQRVAECALACAVLARALGRPLARLGDLPQPAATLVDLPRLLPEGPRSIAELVLLTGVRAGDLAQCRPDPATLANPERFVLRARVRHVLSEAARVAEAERTLAAGDLPAFGALMNASHQSCAGDYEVSTPALDDLAGVARRSGALGARLTGAGFGGAIVALVRPDGVERLLAGLDRDFYLPRGGSPSARFVVRASAGASLACF